MGWQASPYKITLRPTVMVAHAYTPVYCLRGRQHLGFLIALLLYRSALLDGMS